MQPAVAPATGPAVPLRLRAALRSGLHASRRGASVRVSSGLRQQVNALSGLRADLRSATLLRAAVAGWLMGAVIVMHCLAVATIVFNGPLLPFAAQGVGMMLFGGMVFCLVAGTASSCPGMLAVPQEVPATVLGTFGAAVAAGTLDMDGHRTAFMTMTALLVLSGLLTGLLFLAVGRSRLSRLFRFIPYPVVGGFFAGTGGVLSLAAISVMCGESPDWRSLHLLLDPAMAWKWGPGAAYGLALLLLMRRGGSFATLMGSVAVVAALYHLALALLGIPVAEARAQGLLLTGAPQGGLWPAFGIADLAHVDWTVVAAHVPGVLTVVLVTLLCLLVYSNGLEVATGVDIDLDREFRVAGLAGLCAGAGGSAPGCQSFVFTLPCRMLGVDTPWLGVFVASVLAVSLLFGSGMLELLPMPVIGGILLFIGIDLLDSWVIGVRRRLHWADYGTIVLICIVIAAFGFVEGVAAGMLAALVLFAIRVGRADVVAEEFTVRERRSTRIRSVPERALLEDRAHLLLGCRLRGHVFFGNAHLLADRLRRRTKEAPRTCILLDFAEVSGCDPTGVNALGQFVRATGTARSQLVICGASGQVRKSLRLGLPDEFRGRLRFERDLDHGMELCEDMIVAVADAELAEPTNRSRGRLLDRVAADLERHLDDLVDFEDLVERLAPWLEPREYGCGDALTVRGEIQEGLQFVVSGTAAVLDGDGARLRQCGPGDVIETWASFSGHMASATTVARTACRTMMLTSVARELLEADDSELCLRLYAFLISRHSSRRAPDPDAR